MFMGVETEFGIVGGSSPGRARAVQDEVSRSMSCLPAVRSGTFLANGGRVYVDSGGQNEYCTPEVPDPSQLVIHELAGRRLMTDAAARAGYSLLCSNMDPVHVTTWGSHENYGSRSRIDGFSQRMPLLTHLATRLPYTGAGGLHPTRDGVRMVMSPRVCFTKGLQGIQGIDRRTLSFCKQNNYGDTHRNHFICGESLLCHYANYLKYATTALIVACLDRRFPVTVIRFREPLLRIINQVNRDLHLQRWYELSDGRRFSVLDVQESLLDSAEACLGELPSWAAAAAGHWRKVLDDLRTGNEALESKIDWMLYRRLLAALSGELGIDEERMQGSGDPSCEGAAEAWAGMAERTRKELKARANELYIRLHILGKDSLFDELDAEGRLNHRMPEISADAVERAVTQSPAGRAAERSSLIREYCRIPDLKMNWNILVDTRPQPPDTPIVNVGSGMVAVVVKNGPQPRNQYECASNKAYRSFRRGNYQDAIEAFNELEPMLTMTGACSRLESLCLSHARLGNQTKAGEILESEHRRISNEYRNNVYRLFCAVNRGLKPSEEELSSLLQQCDALLPDGEFTPRSVDYLRFIMEQNRACYFNAAGRYRDAEILCRKLLDLVHHHQRSRMMARTRCYLAQALFSQGKTAEAHDEIEMAGSIQVNERLYGDLATYSYPLQARLTEDDSAASNKFRRAVVILRKQVNPLGLARVLTVKARRLKTDEDKWEITQLIRTCDALKDCTLARRIVSNWEEWKEGLGPANGNDYGGM